MKSEDRPRYWLDRFKEDEKRLEEDKKISLLKCLLVDTIPLSGEEADFFIKESPKTGDMEKLRRYSNIESKVGRAYSSGFLEDPELKERFRDNFRKILTGFYTKEELEEIISYMDYGEHLAVGKLVGFEHPIIRKIRNAYLPLITDLVEVSVNKNGKIVGGRDLTPLLFDGEGDAVDQIERILGVDKHKKEKKE
jgi:hypothetical protein